MTESNRHPWSSEAVVEDYVDGGNRVWYEEVDHLAALQEKDLTLYRAEEAWRGEVRVRSLEQYEQGVKDERARIRRGVELKRVISVYILPERERNFNSGINAALDVIDHKEDL
jgi:hypothetical protein